MKIAVSLFLPVALSVAGTANGYELATHGLLTYYGFKSSALAQPSFQRNLGIDIYNLPRSDSSSPLGGIYVDMGTDLVPRHEARFERAFMPRQSDGFTLQTDSTSLEGWLVRGAIREDDTPRTDPLSNDDPVNAIRPLNHFFDPVHNVPLTSGGDPNGAVLGTKNPDWALGTVDAFSNADGANDLRLNHFSVFDAREAMWRALTLRDRNDSPVDSFDGMTKEAIRKAYWATTFRALGDLLHMIQDMAQPQHSRNEPHSGIGSQAVQQNIAGHGSVYENYLEARATGDLSFTVPGAGGPEISVSDPKPLNLTGYPSVPSFSRYIDYFTTSLNSNSQPGYGMADYSNRRFFTERKNLGNSGFSLPSNDPGAYSECTEQATNWDGTLISSMQVQLLCGQVVDEVDGAWTANTVPLTAQGVWDQSLGEQGKAGVYHLVRQNFDHEADLLLPRAVAYSAGLLNFFFRGTLEISPPDDGVYAFVDHSRFSGENAPATDLNGFKGFNKIRVKLRNATAAITPPGASTPVDQTVGAGKLLAVVKFHRNTCYSDDLSHIPSGDQFRTDCRSPEEEIVVSETQNVAAVAADAPTAYEFTFDNEIPINVTDAYLQVVFRGQLGQEADGIAIATKDISEPTYIELSNAHDYIWIDGAVHTRAELATTPTLLDHVQPRSCVDANNQLVDGCFDPVDAALSLTIQVTPGAATNFSVAALPVQRFVRVAFLADADAAPTFTLVGCQYSGANSIPPFLEEVVVSSDGVPNNTFRPLTQTRGIYTEVPLDCVLSGDGTSPAGNFSAGMTVLPDPHPLAVDSVTPIW